MTRSDVLPLILAVGSGRGGFRSNSFMGRRNIFSKRGYGRSKFGAAVTFQAEVEVWVDTVEKGIIKEQEEATAKVA